MSFKQINVSELTGKRVVIRIDANVPVEGGQVVGGYMRLRRALKTITALQSHGARTIVLSHRGRPERPDPELSLLPIVRWFRQELDPGSVLFEAEGLEALKASAELLAKGDVLFAENLRFYSQEKANDVEFAAKLAALADVYINDAFATCHRAHASVVAITEFIPAYAGPRLIEELEALEPIVNPTKRPFVAVIGGAKIKSKLGAVESLLTHADEVFLGGALANTCFVAQGHDVGASFYKEEEVELAKRLLEHKNLRLPSDVVLESPRGTRSAFVNEVLEDEKIIDLGPQSLKHLRTSLEGAKTLLWNGPVGIAEQKTGRVGTDAIAHLVARVSRGSAFGVVGGGDTIGIPEDLGLADFIDHISTGGGAMLEYVGGNPLPGLTVLRS